MNNLQTELSLRDLIEVIWKNKLIIIIITSIAIIVSGVISFFVLPPKYQVASIIRVGNDSSEDIQRLNSISETLKSDIILLRVLNLLNLNDEYTIDQLRSNLNVDVIKNTSVMRIRLVGDEPSTITQIVNLLAYEMASRVEVTDLAQKMKEANERLFELEQRIATAKEKYEATSILLEETPEKLITRQAFSQYPYLTSIVGENTGLTTGEIGDLQFESEHINPLYTTLKSRLTDISIELVALQEEKENLNHSLLLYDNRIQELEKPEQSFDLQSESFQTAINGMNTVFISPAIEPENPIGPRKLINILIGTLIGLIIGLLMAFVKHFWYVDRRNDMQHRSSHQI